MTRCKHCSYNYQLKSSAYNQTGQCYEVQLAAYNAMTNHLHRVLLAKSVVDCGKVGSRVSTRPNTSRRVKTQLVQKREASGAKESLSERLINRLAYDTKHHPHEVASLSWGCGKHCSSAKYNSERKGMRSNSTDSEDSGLRDHQDSIKSYEDKCRAGSVGRTTGAQKSPPRQQVRGSSSVKKKHRLEFEDSGESEDFADPEKLGKSNREEDRHASKSFREEIPYVISSSEILFPETPESVPSRIGSILSTDLDGFSNDVSLYVTFVYDITKEVMDRGYYSDREIEKVFEKHFLRNLGRLDKTKMLREINSLKKALNMTYNSEDEGEDDTVNTASGFALCSIRSSVKPTNTNKTVKKRVVLSQGKIGSKPKLQIPNAEEILVTKEDVLTTLLEMDLNPDKAQEICKSLENRSKEIALHQEMQISSANEGEDDMRYSRNNTIHSRESNKLNDIDYNTELNLPYPSKLASFGSSPDPKQEDRKGRGLILTEEKITKSFESFAKVSSDSVAGGNHGMESEKDTAEGISENQVTVSSISNRDSQRSDSLFGQRSANSGIESKIDVVKARSDDLISDEVSKSDDTEAAEKSKQLLMLNNDADPFVETEGISAPSGLVKIGDVSDSSHFVDKTSPADPEKQSSKTE